MKMELRSSAEARALEAALLDMGYEPSDERTELDLVPDTDDYALRNAGLLLRFRLIRRPTTPVEVLVTLKIRNGVTTGYQDNEELEFYLDGRADARERYDAVNTVLREELGLEFPGTTLWAARDFDTVYTTVAREMKLTALRALIEKHRRTFVHANITVSIDTFPNDIGRFVEIETPTPGDLFLVIYELRLPQARQDPRWYGQIIESKQANLPGPQQRTCLFPETRAALESHDASTTAIDRGCGLR